MKLSIIIPVYNEGKTIKDVLSKVLKQTLAQEVIVVDDGSNDKTVNLLEKIKSQNPKVKIMIHPKNLGKGAAVRTGISKATGDYVLIQDADLEYDPSDYKKLISHASYKKAVYGSRLLTKNPHAYNRTYLGNIFITNFCNILFGTKLTDSYTCYKLLPTKIAKALNLYSNGFEIEAEITGKLAKRKIPIKETPISYKPRGYEEGKKIKAKDALKGLLVFLKIKLGV
jgi:dolichol-phosphate mannosyltransferase